MEISRHVIIGRKIKDRAPGIIRNLGSNEKENAFLITTGASQGSLMYILSLKESEHDFYQERGLRVLGIAKSRSEARGIVRRIFEEADRAGALGDMKRFLEEY